MEEIFQQMVSIDAKEYFAYLTDEDDGSYYDLEPNEDDLKYKSRRLMETRWYSVDEDGKSTNVEDLQCKSIKKTHQITLKYVYNNCKEELMQYKDRLEALPWTIQKELASDATNILCYCNVANLIQWVKKILPVTANINDQKKLVIDFQDKEPRFIDLYFLLIHHYLVTGFESERLHDFASEHGGCDRFMIDFTCPDWLSFLACDGPIRWDDIDEFLKDYEMQKLINPGFSYLPLEEMD